MDGDPFEVETTVSRRLADEPDWRYLLREVYELYRNSGAGGSEAIRRHQRNVREAVSRAMKDPATPILDRMPEQKPVNRHFKRALDLGRFGKQALTIYAIENVADRLAWLYGYDKVPRGLVERFAWCEFAGPLGPIRTADVIVGQVLFAPSTIYPSHAHSSIAESYYVLSGSVSQNDDGVFAPGSMMFNPPGRRHRITVGGRDPALLLYAWHGPQEALAGQKLTFRKAV